MNFPKRVLFRLLGLAGAYLGRIAAGLALLLVCSGLTLLGPLLVKDAIDNRIAGRDARGLFIVCGLYFLLQAVLVGCRYSQSILLGKVGQDILNHLRLRLFSHLQRLSLDFFERNSSGSLLARVEGDIESLSAFFPFTLTALAGDLVLLLGMLAIMTFIDIPLTALMVFFFVVLMAVSVVFQKTIAALFLEMRKCMSDISSFLVERLQGVAVVQILRRELREVEKLGELGQKTIRKSFGAERQVILFWSGVHFWENLALAMVLWMGVGRISSGALTVGALVLFIQYLQRFFAPVHQLSMQLQNIQRALAAGQRVFELLDAEPSVKSPAKPTAWAEFRKDITFDHVYFAYQPGHWVLEDVAFTLPKGQHWALVGVTGGGKTSLIHLLLRFYDPQRGRILVDGIDIRDIDLRQLRAKIGIVFQDTFLFPENVMENVRLNGAVADADVRRAAAQASAHEFIARLPQGYDTKLAERGLNLSMGERQLLSFARLLVHDPPILLLDEATGSIDPDTEKRIQRAFYRVRQARTSLTIAHRLSTVDDSDWILVLYRGKIIERGTHRSLLDSGPYYRKLYELYSVDGKV